MPLVPILDLELDVKPFFALACCDANEGALRFLRTTVESQARAYVGHCISQNTITNEFQRLDDIGYGASGGSFEIVGDMVYSGAGPSHDGHILQLGNGFVRSISDLREDSAAMFGQGATDFAAGTALTSGTHFFLELDRTGLSRSGRVLRANGNWSCTPGTIRITYVAGLTKAELSDEWAYVKLALVEDMQIKFNAMRSQRSSGGGPIKSEKYVGDYEVQYDTMQARSAMGDLSDGTRTKLWPLKRIAL